MNIKKPLTILLFFALAVTLLETVNLTKVSLWHDEAFSALLVQYDFSEMISRIKMDVHPPLYYIILRGWTDIFSTSLFSLRMFSAFFSFLAIFAVYALINKAFKNRTLALFSSLLYALSYFQIQYAMEARMYSLGAFLVIGSSYLLLKAIEEKKLKWWFFYASAVSLGIYTHYFAAFWVISQAIYLIIFFRKELKFAVLAYLLALISFVPWLPTFLKQFSQVQESYWIPAMNIWSIPNTFSKMTIGASLDDNKYWQILILLVILIAAASVFFLKKMKTKEKWLFLIQLFLPFFIAAILSYKRSIYMDRYFIFGFPFYMTILAGAILAINPVRKSKVYDQTTIPSQLIRKKWLSNGVNKKIIKTVLVLTALIGISITFPVQWNSLNVGEKPGMANAAAYLNENTNSDEKIFVGSSLIYFAFKYYNESEIPAKLYAPDALPHFSGTALLSKDDIIADFSKETKKSDTVWMLNTTGFGNYQPVLPQNWIKLDEKGFQEVNAYQGWIIVSKYRVE